MQPEAIIFDMDGTIVDTEHLWDEVRRGLARDAGLPWPEGTTQAMMGMSTGEWSQHLVDVVGLPLTAPEAAEATVTAMAAHYRDGVTVLPGAVESVRRMGERYRLAIASSSPRLLIDTAIDVLGIADLIEVSVSTEEVERGKPSPDGFLRAAELLGVAPERCVVVEDSSNGILAGLAAGMAVVAVPPHFHPPAADLLARATVIDTLHELTHDLIERLPDPGTPG